MCCIHLDRSAGTLLDVEVVGVERPGEVACRSALSDGGRGTGEHE